MIDDKKVDDKDYYWLANEVMPHIIGFLDSIFPGSIIVQGFNKVDIMILNENLPIEVQATYKINNGGTTISSFEDNIRRQIEQNIEISGRCWLFFDKKLLRYLNTSDNKNISLNLDWLYQLWESEKVRMFTVTYNGVIKEITNDDWKFLPSLSQTCKLSIDDDIRVLQKNRATIFLNVLKSNSFTTKEIYKMYMTYMINHNGKRNFNKYLMRNGHSSREELYYDIINSVYKVDNLNNAFKGKMEYNDISRIFKYGYVLGLIDRPESYNTNSQISVKFSDKYDIAKYFPGYIKNKGMWDYLKTRWLDRSEFYGIITGTYMLDFIKKQHQLSDYK